jgi:hypothetical protein
MPPLGSVAHRGYCAQPVEKGGVAAGVLAVAGVTYASTEVFGHNQVGTEYANGIQVSDDQVT